MKRFKKPTKANNHDEKLAKGPVSISTLSPSHKLLGGSSVPEASHLSIKPEINWSGSGLGFPSKLTSFETPIVLVIVRNGAKSEFTLTNMYPGNRGLRSLTKLEAFLRVIFCMGRKVSNPCRCKLRSAKRWLFGLNCIKYQWFIAPPGLRNRSLLSDDNNYLKIDKPIFWIDKFLSLS